MDCGIFGRKSYLCNLLIFFSLLVDFENVDNACCHMSRLHSGLAPCLPHATICPNRSKYLFWDSYHVTESANLIVAKRILDGDSIDISPINIHTLSKT